MGAPRFPVATAGSGVTVVRVLLRVVPAADRRLLFLREAWLLPLPGELPPPPHPPCSSDMMRSSLAFPDLLPFVLVTANPQTSPRQQLYQKAKSQVRFPVAGHWRLTEAHPGWIPRGV